MKKLADFHVCLFIALLAGLVLLLPGAAQGRVYAAPAMNVGYDANRILGQAALPKWWVDTAEAAANADDRARLANASASEQDRSIAAPVAGIVSDDFNTCTLDDMWTYVDPRGDVTQTLMGTLTDDAWLSFEIPGGVSHDIWQSGNFAPRIMQPADDVDFEVEAKFESGLELKFEMQGILVEQDGDDFLRLEFYSDGADTYLFAASFEPGTPPNVLDAVIHHNEFITDTPRVAPLYMRVGREGDVWAHAYSYDGVDWTDPLTFTHELTVTKVGVYGATGGAPAPAHNAYVDYFFNTASPITPEDGDRNTLTVGTVGDGTVDIDPPQASYDCGDVVTLTANAETGWVFADWSGDLTGSENPATVTMTGSRVITATFIPEEYTLTVNEVGNGDVGVDPESGPYHYGDVVTLTATADPGWTFAGWSGDVVSTENPVTFIVDGDETVTATFTQDEYTLTVNEVGNGDVDVDPESGPYHYGDVVTLTATADPGWTFAGWSGDVASTENPVTFIVDGDETVTATFTEDEYTLTVIKVGSGDIDVDPESGPCRYGDVVTLTATADLGWIFDGWSGDVASTENPVTITMDGDKTVTATFIQEAYTLTVNEVGNGDIGVDPESGPYHYGDVVTLTATADPGWTFAGWSGDVVSAENPVTFVVDGDETITATFTQDEYTLTVNEVGNGDVDVDPESGPYHYGDVVTLTATADLGWTFEGWSGDVVSTENPATFVVDGDETVTATFTEDEYTLTVTKVGSGDIDVDPEPGPYRYGDVVTLTATADPDWSFAGWTGDVEGTENPVTITMDGSKAVTATFTPDAEYTLTVNVIGNGSVSKTPSRLTYLPGEMVTLRAIPAAAWNFEGWSGDLVSADNPVTVTVTGDTVVEATFTTYPVYLPFVSHSTSP